MLNSSPAALPQEGAPVTSIQEDVCVPQAVMIIWRWEDTLAVPTLDLNTFQLVTLSLWGTRYSVRNT